MYLGMRLGTYTQSVRQAFAAAVGELNCETAHQLDRGVFTNTSIAMARD
jgi:hypothetical protein